MMYFNGDADEVNSYADDWLLFLRLVLRYNLQFSDGQRRNFSAEGPTHVLSPRGSILHTLFYLIFITAAQWKETREKRTCFFFFSALIWTTFGSHRLWEEWTSRTRREKGKTECLASFALFIFFLYSLNLNIIFLSVYLNFRWIKREWEDVNNRNRPQIGKTDRLSCAP